MSPIAKEGKVTAVVAQRRHRRRVNVFVDDGFAFSLFTVVAERAGLRPGLVLSEAEVDRLEQEDARQAALDSALGFLTHRPRSERELRQNLARKGVPPALVDQAVARLTELSLMDDTAFARYWVESRDRFSPRGTRALRSELLQKGVAREITDAAIEEGDDEEQRARAVAQKRIARLSGLDHAAFRQRLFGFLTRRGFSFEVSTRVVRELWLGQSPADDGQEGNGD